MRHGKSINHLSRKSAHRKALLSNLASSLIMHKRIKTTTAKAKELRTFIEPIITRSKEDSTHSRRLAFSYLGNKNAVSELFREVSSKIGDRPGGYTRIMKIDSRAGDNADMCIIELVDYNENLLGEKEAAKAKTGRKRRGKRKPAEARTAGETEAAAGEIEGGIEEAIETSTEEDAETSTEKPSKADKGETVNKGEKTKAGKSKAAEDEHTKSGKKSKTVKAKAHKPETGEKEA
jgi:large subunit ribosomal protein L17